MKSSFRAVAIGAVAVLAAILLDSSLVFGSFSLSAGNKTSSPNDTSASGAAEHKRVLGLLYSSPVLTPSGATVARQPPDSNGKRRGQWDQHRRILGLVPLDAPQRSDSPTVKLYVFDCGTLKDRDPGTYNLTRDQVQATDMSDPCFLIVHSRGSLLWETGLNDATFNRPGGGGARGDKVDRSLKSQLEQVGFSPQSITYLAMSHSHGDHSGNANDYTSATWLVQRAEHANMFRTQAASPAADPASWAALKNSKTMLLDGDHDVFGDGTVILKATPGHTPGHQSLFVRLAKTGPLMLSGDLYHFPAERTLKKMPTREAENGQTAASREKLEAFMRDTGAALWIQHDMVAYRGLKLAPAYYE